VQDSLEMTVSMRYPFTLVRAVDLMRETEMVRHENMRDKGKLQLLDSLDAVKAFREQFKIIFFSHQWTSFNKPDHTTAHHRLTCRALQDVCENEGWALDEVFVWVDYTSIPQAHRGIQALAIQSLVHYSANTDAFVIIAPKVQHEDTGVECNAETYQRRAWCRAEQFAQYLINGTSRMWLATEAGVNPVPKDWASDFVEVFHGDLTCCRIKHKGMPACDRVSLVLPFLGLYGQLLKESQESGVLAEVADKIQRQKDEIFPQNVDVEWIQKDGTTTIKKTRLFGELIEAMEIYLESGHNADELKAQFRSRFKARSDGIIVRLQNSGLGDPCSNKSPSSPVPNAGGSTRTSMIGISGNSTEVAPSESVDPLQGVVVNVSAEGPMHA